MQPMIKYLMILVPLFYCSLGNTALIDQTQPIQSSHHKKYLSFGTGSVATAENYDDFDTRLLAFVGVLQEEKAENDFESLCIVQNMILEYLINNIRYSQEYNQKNPNRPYEKMLSTITQDQLNNKRGCDGEINFYPITEAAEKSTAAP